MYKMCVCVCVCVCVCARARIHIEAAMCTEAGMSGSECVVCVCLHVCDGGDAWSSSREHSERRWSCLSAIRKASTWPHPTF